MISDGSLQVSLAFDASLHAVVVLTMVQTIAGGFASADCGSETDLGIEGMIVVVFHVPCAEKERSVNTYLWGLAPLMRGRERMIQATWRRLYRLLGSAIVCALAIAAVVATM